MNELTTTDQQLTTTDRPNPFALTSFQDVEKMASYIAEAKMYGIKTAAQAVTLMMLAHEEGKTVSALMRQIHVFEDGKISQRADWTQAEFERVGRIVFHIRTDEVVCATFFLKKEISDEERARGADRCELLRQLEDMKWTDPRNMEKERKVENQLAKLARENEETVLRTLADADTRGISQGSKGTKTNWATSPRSMLQWRCVTEGVKVVAPFVLAGMPSDVELQDAKVMEAREVARVVNAPEVTEKDTEIILDLIAQHDAELATDLSDNRRKTVQGLRSDLVCKLADLGITIPKEPEAPAPTVGGLPAKTVETTLLPPEPATQAPKATRQRRPAPTATNETPAPTAGSEPEPATRWQDVVCHLGTNPGAMFDHTLGELFLTGKRAPKTETQRDALVKWFEGAMSGSTIPKDVALWKAVDEAKAAWKPPTTPEPASATTQADSTETPPKAAEASQPPKGAQGWQDFTISSKSPLWDGKKLGDLTPEEVLTLKTEYLDKIDTTRATIGQKTLIAKVALALADLAKVLPNSANAKPAESEHTAKLKEAIAAGGLNRNDFLSVCIKNGYIPEGTTRIEDISETDGTNLLLGWEIVSAEVKAAQP